MTKEKTSEATAPIIPNIIINIEGQPGTGKTHLALTFPAPILLFSFDIGYRRVMRHFPGLDIDIKEYPIPIIDTMKPKPFARRFWNQFYGDVSAANGNVPVDDAPIGGKETAVEVAERKIIHEERVRLAERKFKTIIVDTGTTLYEIARFARQEELGRPIVPYEYGEIYARLRSVVMQSFYSGTNFVVVHHLKDRYVDDKNTGELETAGYGGLKAIVDTSLRMTTRLGKGEASNVVVSTFEKCGYDVFLVGKELENATYDDLIAAMGLEV